MKKIFVVMMLMMFCVGGYVEARVQFDSSGRNIIQDDSIRARRRAAQTEKINQNIRQRNQAAAAAKFDYENAYNNINNNMNNNLKNNYYQRRTY